VFALDNSAQFVRVLALDVPWAHSYADMRPGKTDRERREKFRGAAAGKIEATPPTVFWWAFRIAVHKVGRPLDVDNVAKTIIDSFCMSQIVRDASAYEALGLYPDDTFDYVRVLQVVGSRSKSSDLTRIEIFACVHEE
jgi:hypothetical protein